MQGVVLLLLPCQTLFSAGLASIAVFADDSHTALSWVWAGQLKQIYCCVTWLWPGDSNMILPITIWDL